MTRLAWAGVAGLGALVGITTVWAAPPDGGVIARSVAVGAMLGGGALAAGLALRASISVRTLLLVAVGLRLLALPMAPSLSDDVYRYLWDGELSLAGVSPYAYVPSDPALDGVRAEHAELYSAMNSPDYFSVYPPVTQAVFGVAASLPSVGSAWLVLKGLVTLAELVGIWCFARVLPAARVALYAWSPLAVVEVAGQGHTEGLLVGALGVVWLAIARGRPFALAAGVALAGWVKLFPFALGALLPKRLSWRTWLVFVAFAGALSLSLVGDGLVNVLTSVRLYGGTLDFYAAPFLGLKAALYPWLGETAGRSAASALSALWLLAVCRAWWRDDGSVEAARQLVLVIVVGYALAAAMAHPWNLLGALALAPLMRAPAPMLWLAGVAPLTYLRYVGLDGAYHAALVVGWGGALGLWVWSRYRASGTRSSAVVVAASSQR